MTKQRRTFTPEFKREAASLILNQGYSPTDAARSLGLVESALRRWVSQPQQKRSGVTPTSKVVCPGTGGQVVKSYCSHFAAQTPSD